MPSRSRPTPPFRRTKAVVVVHDGKVIAERYAAGIGVDTPLLGFSMTKSVVNALIGILTQQGLVTPSMPAPIPEWRGDWRSAARDRGRASHAHDHGPRRSTKPIAVSIRPAGCSICTTIRPPMPSMPQMIAPLGTRWHYSSPTTQILARIVRDAVGGPEQTLAFAWRELFNPLGMRNVTLEFDGVGHAAGLDLHAGKRARLGEVRPALPQ